MKHPWQGKLTHRRMIIKQGTYRFDEILRFVPPLRMTVSRLGQGGKRRRHRRLLFPSRFLATGCHPERSEGSRKEFTYLSDT